MKAIIKYSRHGAAKYISHLDMQRTFGRAVQMCIRDSVYPKDSVAAHIIGYMGKMVDEDTVKEYQDKGYSSEDKIGVAGIESTMEQYLSLIHI